MRDPGRPGFGLKGRALLFCVLLLLGAVAMLSVALTWQHQRRAVSSLRQQAMVQAQSLSRTSEPDVLLNNTKGLQRILQAGAAADDFAMAEIVSADGKLLAKFARRDDYASELDIDPQRIAGIKMERGHYRVEWSANQIGVLIPIWREADDLDLGSVRPDEDTASKDVPVGYLLLIYSLASLHAELARHVVVSIAISIMVVAIGVVITFVIVRQLLSPLENLAKTAAAIANGDFTKRASEDAVAEVGALARSFNHMADVIRQYTEGLEAQVSERTAALKDALRRAEAATIAKSEFLANMSHEIRTPMTAIMGYTDVLIEQSYGREAQEPLAIVKRNGQHLLQIINDILDLSKIESGKLDVERVRVSPVRLIAEVKSLMRVRVEAKGLTLAVEYGGAMPETIETDPTRVRQILINLIGNAVKFTETGSVRVVVRFVPCADDRIVNLVAAHADSTGGAPGCARIEAGSPYLQVDVNDTGIGIAPELMDKLFRPFSQADNSMSRRFGGTGLGLAISRRLAQRLGGTVTVESEAGKGSTFSLMVATGSVEGVRMLDKPSDAAVSDTETVPPAPVPEQPGKLDYNILLAEDGPDNQRLISFVLTKAGAKVTIAENGKIAVEMVRDALQQGKPYDVILMDMQMPVLDGYGATGQLRCMKYQGPIVALTAHAMSGDRDKCIAAGCTDYATKPIDRAKLIDTIRRCVEHWRRVQAEKQLVECAVTGLDGKR